MKEIFYPRNVAVIGASAERGNFGSNIVLNLVEFEYPGGIFAVGPKGGTLFGHPIYPSILDVPSPIDLAAIVTPSAVVPRVLEESAQKGVKAAVVYSGGFSEYDRERKETEGAVLEIARRYGIRVAGPNTFGLMNTENGLCLHFDLFRKGTFRAGSIAVLAQSGSVACQCALWLAKEGIGVSKVVSMGNKLHLDEVDFLCYLQDDPQTTMVFIYLEGIRRGRELVELARNCPKPIVILKANTSEATAEVARTHTAALANDDRIVNGAFKQGGIIRIDDIREFVTCAKAFSLPPMAGDRVGAVTISGGMGVITADKCDEHDLVLPPYPQPVLEDIENRAPPKVIKRMNPLDLVDVLNDEVILYSVERVLECPAFDAMTLSLLYFPHRPPTAHITVRSLVEKVATLSRRVSKPVAMSFLGELPLIEELNRELDGFPVFYSAEEAIEALAISRDYHRFHQRKLALLPAFDANQERARHLLSGLPRGIELGEEAMDLLDAYGIPVASMKLAENAAEALKTAGEVGYPLAMKISSPQASHKSDVGGVVLDITDAAGVERAYGEIVQNVRRKLPEAIIEGVFLQRMVPEGKETILGAKYDDHFGHVLMYGMGGIYVELFQDVSFRLAPLTLEDVREMVSEVRFSTILKGVRGEKPSDVPALIEVLLRLSRLVTDFPEIRALDLNPIKVMEEGQGCIVVDARMILG